MGIEQPERKNLSPKSPEKRDDERSLKKPVVGPGGQTWTEKEVGEEIRRRREGSPFE